MIKRYGVLEGEFPQELEDWGPKLGKRNKLEAITYGLYKNLSREGLKVYGLCADFLKDSEIYNIQWVRKDISATLMTMPSIPDLPCSVYIIGSRKSQEIIAKMLQLKNVKRKHYHSKNLIKIDQD